MIIVEGSIPVSAILPAKIDNIIAVSSFITFFIFFNWLSRKIAVTLHFIELSDNFPIIINYLINLSNLFLKKQQKSQKSLYIP